MSFTAWTASKDELTKHLGQCQKPCCEVCATIYEREAEAELDAEERAEVRRDLGLDDNDRSDFCGDDMRSGEPSRA